MDNLKEQKAFSPWGPVAIFIALIGNLVFFIGITDQWNERHPIATTIICTITMAVAGWILTKYSTTGNWQWIGWCALVGAVEGALIGFAV